MITHYPGINRETLKREITKEIDSRMSWLNLHARLDKKAGELMKRTLIEEIDKGEYDNEKGSNDEVILARRIVKEQELNLMLRIQINNKMIK